VTMHKKRRAGFIPRKVHDDGDESEQQCCLRRSGRVDLKVIPNPLHDLEI